MMKKRFFIIMWVGFNKDDTTTLGTTNIISEFGYVNKLRVENIILFNNQNLKNVLMTEIKELNEEDYYNWVSEE